jgi:transposase
VPKTTLLEIPAAEQQRMVKALRRARYGYVLSLHILLLCSNGYNPTEIAAALFCSRTSVYRAVKAWKRGEVDFDATSDETMGPPVRATELSPTLRRSLTALLSKCPRAFGWCRQRWSCATLALQLQVQRGVSVSAETMRRWVRELGWVWKRASLVAKDSDPKRVSKLAQIRLAFEGLKLRQALFFADELDIHLLPKVGYQWTPKGERVEVMTPGTNQKNYLAGALDIQSGQIVRVVGERKNSALFIELLEQLDAAYPAQDYDKLSVVVDNYIIHSSKQTLKWLAAHPRFELLPLPTYCPKANPIERAFGDVHDKCTRNHQRKRLEDLLQDILSHLQVNGPWRYKLSELYYDRAVTDAMRALSAASRKVQPLSPSTQQSPHPQAAPVLRAGTDSSQKQEAA